MAGSPCAEEDLCQTSPLSSTGAESRTFLSLSPLPAGTGCVQVCTTIIGNGITPPFLPYKKFSVSALLGPHAMRRTGALLASALAIAQLQVPSQSEEEHAGSAY